MSEMLKQVQQAKEEAAAAARGEQIEQAEELPQGASPLEASAEAPVAEEPAAETVVEAASTQEKLIRIGSQTFKTDEEAEEYVLKLERDKLVAEGVAVGVKEALSGLGAQSVPTPVVEEEDLEAEFYANPKETLKKVQAKARDEALAAIRAEQHKESLWNEFLTEYPDLERVDAERIIIQHAKMIDAITDKKKAMAYIAEKTREDYRRIADRLKPRTELPQTRQVQSLGGTPTKSVTPAKKDERPLSFAEQMRQNKAN